jgi:hypothetical protein
MVTDDEDPLPALQRCLVVQTLVHSCHHDTSKHATDLADGCEDGCSFRDLQWFAVLCSSSCCNHRHCVDLLPRSKDVYRPAVKTGFEEALQKADNTQLAIGLARSTAHC